MKNLINFWSLIVLIALSLSSCSKNEDFDQFDTGEQFDVEQFDQFADEDNDVGPATDEENGALTLYRVNNGISIQKIKDYTISKQLESYQQDLGKHHEMWDFYSRLIPKSQRQFITEFEVFYGGGDLAGYVNTIGDDNSKWKLGLAIDLAQDLSTIDLQEEFTYVCIHEQGHILSLNHTQLDSNTGNCSQFETAEGCAKENAYINRLFQLGWADIYDEHQNINSDQDAEDFYNKYSTRFVTSYAASNPGEDFAEVFAFYVTLETLPSGNTIADQKVRLLNEFPELVQLRQEIRKDPVLRSLRAGSWTTKACRHSHKKHSVKH